MVAACCVQCFSESLGGLHGAFFFFFLSTGRLLRLLAAEHYVDEVGEDRYRATPMSSALGDLESPTRLMFQ